MRNQSKIFVFAFCLSFLLAAVSVVSATDPSYRLDFDGDGKTDIAVFDADGGCGIIAPSSAYFRYKSSLTGQTVSIQWGNSCHLPVPADYDADDITDTAIFNPYGENNEPTNQWWILKSSNNNYYVQMFGNLQQFVPRDYDGNLTAQPATLQLQVDEVDPENPNDDYGQWYFSYLHSNNESTIQQVTGVWTPTSQTRQYAAPGDYNGIGFSSPVIFQRDYKEFWVFSDYDSNPVPEDKISLDIDYPTPGDYDGDGRTDYAGIDDYENPSATNLVWRVKFNTGNTPEPSDLAINWGVPGDLAVPGDYDGDGKTDIAVFRPSNTTWYIRRSSDSGTTTVVFGESDDTPLAMPIQHGQL
jgi:hypothetical protein